MGEEDTITIREQLLFDCTVTVMNECFMYLLTKLVLLV